MCKLICISNRSVCKGNYIERLRNIIDLDIPVILREKDLTEDEYYKLLCDIDRKEIIAHSFPDAARRFGTTKIHLPLHILKSCNVSGFEIIGASTHSITEAVEAQHCGATYITAGHVFPTDCKKGVPPHGVELISDVTKSVSLPVYALGGISPANAESTVKAGAYGIALMSGFMKCENVAEYAALYKHILKSNN